MGKSQKRTHDAITATRNGCESRGTRTTRYIHKKGFRAIVGVVCRHNTSRGTWYTSLLTQFICQLICRFIPNAAAGVLHVQVVGRGNGCDVERAHHTRDAIFGGKCANKLLVLLGICAAKLVVDMKHTQAILRYLGTASAVLHIQNIRCGHNQKCRRIGTSRNHQHHRRSVRHGRWNRRVISV